jgi:hypothetical protein
MCWEICFPVDRDVEDTMTGMDRKAEAVGLTTMSAKKKTGESGHNLVQFPLSKANRPRVSATQPGGGVEYTNRKGRTYYLHVGKTKKGNPRYYFSMKLPAELVKSIPEGYEIYENVNAQVFLRKILPKEILDQEMAVLEKELRAHAKPTKYRIDVKGKVVTIFWNSQSGPKMDDFSSFFGLARIEEFYESHAYFTPIFRFTLVEPKERLFIAERFCFRGSIDDWMHLLGGGPDSLQTLAGRYVKHLGEESFYELM